MWHITLTQYLPSHPVFTCYNFKISNLPPLFCWFLSLLLLPLVWLEVLLTKCLELLEVAAEFTKPVLAELLLLLLLSLLTTPLTPLDKLELATIFPQDRDDEDTWWPSSAAAAMPWQFDEFFRMLFAAAPPLLHNGAFSRVFVQYIVKFGLSEKHTKFEKIFLVVLTNQLIYLVNV